MDETRPSPPHPTSGWLSGDPLGAPKGWAAWARWVGTPVTDLICPATCLWCGMELPDARQRPYLCEACCRVLFAGSPVHCVRCAMPVSRFWSRLATGDCPSCRVRSPDFQAAFSLGVYRGELEQAVRRMKYVAGEPLCESVAIVLAERLMRLRPDWDIDVVTALPMHWSRRLVRRTNPAETLAEGMGHRLRRQADCRILQLRRKIKKQGTLSPHQRRQNVSGAFGVRAGYDLAGVRVLLVDDVLTTGASADAATRALRAAGAAEVRVAVVARGTGATGPSGSHLA